MVFCLLHTTQGRRCAPSPRRGRRSGIAAAASSMAGPQLRFCPESNDLLYPKEDKDRKVLVYTCRNCGFTEDAPTTEWCVYRNEVHHTSKEKSVVLQVRGEGVDGIWLRSWECLISGVEASSARPHGAPAGRALRPDAAAHQGRAVPHLQPQRGRLLLGQHGGGDDPLLQLHRLWAPVEG